MKRIRVTYEENEDVVKYMNTKVPRQKKSEWIRVNNRRQIDLEKQIHAHKRNNICQ